MLGRKTTLASALLAASAVSTTTVGQTTVIQSNTGIGCSTVCIDGNCTSTCGDGTTTTVTTSSAMKGNGDVVDRVVEEKDFTEVVSTDVDTTVLQGESFAIKVHADSNLQDRMEVKKEGEVLHVRLKSGQYQNATLEVEVTMPDLRKLTQNGAADLQFSGFDQSNLELNVNGAGQVSGKDNLVTNLVLNSQGASTLDLMGSELTNAEVHVGGTAQIRLNFHEGEGQITGDVQGVSEIQYCGNPDNRVSVFGVADIVRVKCS